MMVTQAAIEALAHIQITNHKLVITEKLERSVYVQVDKVLQALGGKWSKADKAHVFDTNPAEAIEAILLTGEYTDAKKEFDAFYTPASLADRLADLAKVESNHRVLEPSIGTGALALAVKRRAWGATVVGYELQEIDPWWHKLDGSPTITVHSGRDFLQVAPRPSFDRVVMNPPFSRQQDMLHVSHAFEFLRPGGRLVAVMGPAWQWRETGVAKSFRGLVRANGYHQEDLPAGTFKESGTMVNSTIVILERG